VRGSASERDELILTLCLSGAVLAIRSALRSGQSIRERWSATCSFDVGDQLHTFSACTLHDSAAAAQESLAQQLTQQDVCWRLVFACVLHELKAKRRATGSTATGPSVLRLLHKDKAELAALERVEHECAERSSRAVQSQVAASPVLRLDALLSARSLPAMIYSAEQVGIQGSRSRRAVWSVAAQLPPPLLSQGAFGSGSGTVAQAAAAIKDDKVSRRKLIMLGDVNSHGLDLKKQLITLFCCFYSTADDGQVRVRSGAARSASHHRHRGDHGE